MPVLGLVSLGRHVKRLKAPYLLFQLYDEADLGTDAEVAYAEETDRLQESKSVQLLFISPQRSQVFQLHRRDLHDVAYVEG